MSRITQADLAALDAADPLRRFRGLFALPAGVVYLDGNSLGPLPKSAPARLAEMIEREWGDSLIRAWNRHGWIDLAARVGDDIARLIGAAPGTTMVADSTSINVFKTLAAALAQRPDRRVILSEQTNFPTDLYMAEGLAALLDRGHRLRLVAPDALAGAMDAEVAVLLLSHVNYRSGALHDMAALTRAAHAAGALTVWDLAHSAGAVPVALAEAGADFAVGCGYKFLNGGPGAPAFLYAAPAMQAAMTMPLTGWLGHADPFAFEPGFRPAEGIARAVVGTPPILSLGALAVGVAMLRDAPIAELRAKSQRLTGLFMELVAQECGGHGLGVITPGDPARRGSQVSLTHPDGYAIMQALIEHGVIGDFRAPDILRFGIAPLYNSFAELWDAVAALRAILHDGRWRDPRFSQRGAVT